MSSRPRIDPNTCAGSLDSGIARHKSLAIRLEDAASRILPETPHMFWFRLAGLRCEPRFDSQTLASRIPSPPNLLRVHRPRLALQSA
eukprot:2798998-Alexandrium_andersonii.AAC.1